MKITELIALRDYWYPIAKVDEMTPKLVELFGEEFVLWNSIEGPSLVQAYCPHRGARLDCASQDTGQLVCPYHGWEFAHDGKATLIPQLEPKVPIPPKAKLATYHVTERYGLVWACIGEPATQGPPAWLEADELGWRVQVDFFEVWASSAFRIIDNNLDQSHPAFVHKSTFGDPTRPRIPQYEVESTPIGFRTRIPQFVGGVGPQMGIEDEDIDFDRFQEAELLAPLHTRIRLEYGGTAPDYAFYSCATPIDDTHAIYMRCSALAGDEESQPYSLFHDYSRRVVDEDKMILETTNPDFPIEITSEVHLRCDRNTVEYRRLLNKLSRSSDPKFKNGTSNIRPSSAVSS